MLAAWPWTKFAAGLLQPGFCTAPRTDQVDSLLQGGIGHILLTYLAGLLLGGQWL